MFRRFMVSCLVVLLLCGVFVGLAFATNYILADYSETNLDLMSSLYAVHPSGTGARSAVAQTFTGDGRYLYAFNCWLNKTGGPTGYIRGALWNSTDDIVANSTADLNIGSLTTGVAMEYTFSFPADVVVTDGVSYKVGIFVLSGTLDASNMVQMGFDISGPTGDGAEYTYQNSAWDTSGYDMIYTIFTSDTSGSGEVLPFDVPSGYPSESVIPGLMWWIIYLIVMLLPAWFLGAFLKMGKWGFILGLGIGTGVGYAFVTGFPLWLLVLVAVGELGLAYQTVSHGGG